LSRIRPNITVKEATCGCGCGLMPSNEWLDTTDELIDMCGFPIGISTMCRCKKYNKEIGGVNDSPHREIGYGYGGTDLRCRDPKKRMIIMVNIMQLVALRKITQVEVCDGHIHIANIPLMHRLYECFNWDKSR